MAKTKKEREKEKRERHKPDKKKRHESTTESPREKPAKMGRKLYEAELARLEVELVKLQGWIKHAGLKVAVIFEGRDSAGKGGVIKRITYRLNPRLVRVVALPTPTSRQKTQWYFQRYVPHLPSAGEMVLFDRSWYNRAGVERVMGFCTDLEYQMFMSTVNGFEASLTHAGIKIIKYWLHISDETQEERFDERLHDPRKRWKLSPMDLESRARWVDYSRARDAMIFHTSTEHAPWYIVDANVKRHARLNIISHLLSQIPYEDLTPKQLSLPPRQSGKGYTAPDFSALNFVPQVYP